MGNGYGITPAYQPNYLVERVRAYEDAHADGELIIVWTGRASAWVGNRLALWGQWVNRVGLTFCGRKDRAYWREVNR